MKQKLAYILTLAVSALSVYLVIDKVDQNDTMGQLESEKDHYEYQYELLKSRSDKQYLSNFQQINLTEFHETKGVGEGIVGTDNGDKLFLVFPATACGICYDVVMQELEIALTLNPALKDQVVCVTEREALVDVKAYLKDFNLALDIWLRKRPFSLPVDRPGYPYLFYGQVDDQRIDITHTLIPDKHDPDITKSFMAQLSGLIGNDQLKAMN